MNNVTNTIKLEETRVWDWQTRVLHWLNAIMILTLLITILGYEGMEWLGVEKPTRLPLKEFHAYAGHIFAVTFTLRIIWAFVGNEYARWSDINPFKREKLGAAWKKLKWYAGGMRGTHEVSVGHDPLASLLYVALFIVLAAQVVTGIILSGAEFAIAPGVYPAVYIETTVGPETFHSITEAAEEVHEFGLLFIIFFAVAHLGAVIVHELTGEEGLISSMIHGKKYFPTK